MKKEWKGFLAVLGIFLLAAAFTPACDTGGGDSATDCSALVGTWNTVFAEVEAADTCNPAPGDEPWFPPSLAFSIDGDKLIMDIPAQMSDSDYEPVVIEDFSCSGGSFSFSFEEIEIEDIACNVTLNYAFDGTIAGDGMTGTLLLTATAGSGCAEIGDTCSMTYTINIP